MRACVNVVDGLLGVGCQTHGVPPSLEPPPPDPACGSASGKSLGANPDEARRLTERGVSRLRADNPGPLTLSGTNTWVLGRDPAYVIDPGPALPAHLDRLLAAIDARGGLGGIALTHDHADHSEGVAALRERRPAPLAAGRGEVDVVLGEGTRFGPLLALSTPGHAPDHFALIYGRVCFTGDAVLGEGSVFIAPDPGALAGSLDGLARLRERDLEVLCPGHGPAIWEPHARLEQYIEHRLQRERLLLAALAEGRRSTVELLDAAWADVPAELRPVAAVSLQAHLDKLEDEGRLPVDVERPFW
jgi:glyoxylase-like metal-dependent hydrolase (beta-lactamase superfamily II)